MKLSDVFTMINTGMILAFGFFFIFATKPSDVAKKLGDSAKKVSATVLAVERAVRETNVDIAHNAGDIRTLSSSVTSILAELSNLQLLLKNLYDSLLQIIEARTEDRFRQKDAKVDWLEFQRLNAENGTDIKIPERYTK